MNPNENEYNPADDENQGIITKMIQGEEADTSQHGGIEPVRASGPEAEKAEVNESDTDANGASDDLLAEEEVETGDITESNEQ